MMFAEDTIDVRNSVSPWDQDYVPNKEKIPKLSWPRARLNYPKEDKDNIVYTHKNFAHHGNAIHWPKLLPTLYIYAY